MTREHEPTREQLAGALEAVFTALRQSPDLEPEIKAVITSRMPELYLSPSDLGAAAASALRQTCEWTTNVDGYWDTGCGQAFVTDCGGTLVEVPYVEPTTEDDE